MKREPILQKALEESSSPKGYWVALATALPTVAQIALLLNGIASSEADCERIFSFEGNLHDKKANRMEPDLVEKCVFIRYNWPKLLNLEIFHPNMMKNLVDEMKGEVVEVAYKE